MKDIANVRQRITEVMEKGYLMSIGTIDDGGPWVADVRYVSDNNYKIYWMSDPKSRHSKAIEKNSHVAASIELNFNFGTPNFGLQMSGTVRKLGLLRPDLAIKYVTRRGKSKPSQLANILRDGYSWYEFNPKFIELNDEENFGFDKQKIVFDERFEKIEMR
jgi:uncharacterized protein YhbP (UPF0306 family)